MPLTLPQLSALKAAIAADPALAALPNNGDGHQAIQFAMNAPSNPVATAWNASTPVRAILDAISLAAYTPSDTIPESNVDQASLQRFIARILVVQTKQMNLQLMLQGRDTIDASLPNVRAGLRDALISIPAGVNGAGVAAGGVNATTALQACTRTATRAERLFASSQATTGTVTAWLLPFVGFIEQQDVAIALGPNIP